MGLEKQDFKTLLELSVFNSVFIFNQQYYKQDDGLGMGLPLSPILANIFLCHHENIWLNSCPSDCKPVYYRRYMDDCFLVFRDPSHAPKFLEFLNSRHGNIKFTAELENNRQLSFLDCLVHRINNSFTTLQSLEKLLSQA